MAGRKARPTFAETGHLLCLLCFPRVSVWNVRQSGEDTQKQCVCLFVAAGLDGNSLTRWNPSRKLHFIIAVSDMRLLPE